MGANKWMAGVVLCGLCLLAPGMTTAQTEPPPPGIVMPESVPKPKTAVPAVAPVDPAPKATQPDSPAQQAPAAPLPAVAAKPKRFTLLLPISSDNLGPAANVVRAGFLAAYEQEKEDVSVKVVMTGDNPEEIVSSYTNSLADSDIVIGPLTRNAAAAIAESGAVRLPTISLTQSDAGSDAASAMPSLMMTMGLSVEDEAREAANWIAAGKARKIYVLSTGTAWQRRAAKAFAAKAHSRGVDTEQIELGSSYGFLLALDLDRIKKEIQAEKSVSGYAVFAALDAAQTKQLREVIGNEAVIYGTAQMNPVPLPDRATAERAPELNGVRLLDIPWQLQPDHAAVMVYPRAVVAANQKRSADMERLYALGIDAYRVALQIANQRKQFELDGVTGRLRVNFDKAGAHFERIEPFAIYREGLPAYLSEGR